MDEMINPGLIKPKSSTDEFKIPFDVIDLPSKGKLYRGTTLEGKDSVEIHYLTAIQEDILTSPNLLQSGKMLDVLMKSVLKDKSIDPGDLLVGDRNTLVVWLRSTGYGNDYPTQIQCDSCGSVYNNEFDLNVLEIKSLTLDPDENGCFDFETPKTKKNLKFTFLNCREEFDIIKKVESRQKKSLSIIDNSTTMRMMKMIKSINGNSDSGYIRNFVETMPIKDSKAFRNRINEIEPGIVMKTMATCSVCGESSEVIIPIRDNFFWPDK